MKKTAYHKRLESCVIAASESDNWYDAVKEWKILRCEEDSSLDSSCVCGKENLRYLFTILNTINGNTIFPIGSVCIKKFKRPDLDIELSGYAGMARLLEAVKNREFIELNSKYFSRNLLSYLYINGAFKATEYNGFDPKNTLVFLIDMYNKRKKSDITQKQHKKIRAIIVNDILPFARNKIKEYKRGELK